MPLVADFSDPTILIVLIAAVVFVIASLVSVARSRMPIQDKWLWGLLLIPSVLGSAIWWIFVRNRVNRRRRR